MKYQSTCVCHCCNIHVCFLNVSLFIVFVFAAFCQLLFKKQTYGQ